jgi:protein-disulfide isomerase
MSRRHISLLTLAFVAALTLTLGGWRLAPPGSYAQDDPTPTPSSDALCEAFPLYCAPLVGGSADDDSPLAMLETGAFRQIEREDAVARGVTADGSPFFGDPDAPIRFKVFQDFSCPHCQDYHEADLTRFVEDYVITGQAALEVDLLAFVSQPGSTNAAYAALCAGEQDAFWEANALLLSLGKESGPAAFALPALSESLGALGLDTKALLDCVRSEKYADVMRLHSLLAADLGLTGTPTVCVSDGDSGEWRKVDNRAYDTLAELTEAANED